MSHSRARKNNEGFLRLVVVLLGQVHRLLVSAMLEEEFVESNADVNELANLREYRDDFSAEQGYGYQEAPQVNYTTAIIPDVVRSFLQYFHRNVMSEEVGVIHGIYENTWNKLTDRFYKNSPWPSVEQVAPLVNNDEVFMTLYKELYFRHIYAKLQPTLEHRFESYQNYCNLFNYILNEAEPVPLQLPNPWLWDIIDEFVYQFQSFSQYRTVLAKKSDEELAALKANPQIWNVHSVLNILHSLVEKSNINAQLVVYNSGEGNMDTVAGPFGRHPLYKMLGYFSLIGLCRLHCMLGDYCQSLKVLECVELNKKLLSAVPACQITTFYYVAFDYLMMRRYQDCVRTLANILVYIQRTKQYHNRSYQYDEIAKKNEQMYGMLAIAVTLYPQRIDDNIHSTLREKLSDKMLKMNRGDEPSYEELFKFCCPKFVSPVAPPFDALQPASPVEAQERQVKQFLTEVQQQILLPTVRSYLKLYTTMPIGKLASFMQTDDETFRTYLLLYKHKSRSLVWKGGPPLSGEYQTTSDVDFYLDDDMIHIADTKMERRFGQYFLRQINKFTEVQRNLQRS